MSKERISLSLSLRKKGRKESIGPIVDKWAEQNLDVSEEMANSIIMRNEIATSASLFKLHNTYDMIKQTLQYSIKDEELLKKAVEESMNKIVVIDGQKLTEFFANPITFTSVLDEEKATIPNEKQVIRPATVNTKSEVEDDEEEEEEDEEETPEVKIAEKQNENDKPLQRKKRPNLRSSKKVEPESEEDDDEDDDDDIDMSILNNM